MKNKIKKIEFYKKTQYENQPLIQQAIENQIDITYINKLMKENSKWLNKNTQQVYLAGGVVRK